MCIKLHLKEDKNVIYLMRHGLDDERFVGGHSNVKLTKEGIHQVKLASNYLKKQNLPITRIISSDLTRAVQTAEIVSEVLNLNLETMTLLREQNKGKLNG